MAPEKDQPPPALAVLRHSFEELGLTGSQSRVLLALMSLGAGPATQLFRPAGIPRTAVYTVLEQLQARGLAERIPGEETPSRWTTPSRDEVLHRLCTTRREDLLREQAEHMQKARETELAIEQRLAQLDTVAEQARSLLEGNFSTEAPPAVYPYLKVLRGGHQLTEAYFQLVAAAQTELLVLNRGPYGEFRGPNPAVLDALRRGVAMRALFVEREIAEINDELFRAAIEAYRSAGVDCRLVDDLPMALAIFDRRSVLVSLEDPALPIPGGPTPMLIEHPDYAAIQVASFDHYWEGSRPFPVLETSQNGSVEEHHELVGRRADGRLAEQRA